MFKIYFHTGLRNLLRRKSTTLINLIGLTLGLSAIMVLSVMLYQYLTANGQFNNKNRMYYVRPSDRMATGPCKHPSLSSMR
jgi:putative ABC transport system permease protein